MTENKKPTLDGYENLDKDADGGHAMLFTTFESKLMMVLHSPNGPGAQPHLFEMEDTGETLKIVRAFTSEDH